MLYRKSHRRYACRSMLQGGTGAINFHILDAPEDKMIRPFRPFSYEFPNCTIRNRNGDGIFDFSIGSNDFQDDATATLTMLEDSREEELSASLTNRGKRPKLHTQVAMEKALKASAVVEHISESKYTFQANILYYESNLQLRKIKEALYITT
ncbi:hypothetical protein M513_03892 [Trichuris suis]|uniref:Uncharacterized protein n=1 Tax=Trichuris suis TaxID=68888 RepID=A0A085MDF5_9BILA|nr:hypothetical protein M513_03892 [Trichuris suis]